MERKFRSIYFASRKTNSAEANYPVHRLEFLTLGWAVDSKFKDYLPYPKFKVLTDSKPLSYILKKMNVDDVSQYLAAKHSKFDFEVVYKSGKLKTAADSLSRLTEPSHDDTALKAWCESWTRCARVVK